MWDKKVMVKFVDICQMMLVFVEVKNEEEVKIVLLLKVVEYGYCWLYGIMFLMYDVRNCCFCK